MPLKVLPPLASPPRDVPLLVWLTNLLGGFYNQFGWAWVGFTGVFLWVFVPFADVAGLYYFRGDLETAPGRVVASRETNCSVNDVKVQAQDYRFTASDGRQRQGTSFATGRRLNPGEAVTVEYVPGQPEISRIRGMRRGEFGVEGWGGLIVVMVVPAFASIGVVFLVVGLRKGLRANRLIAGGHPAVGRLASKKATHTRINNQTVWAMTFAFTAGDGQTHETVVRTHKTGDLSDAAGEYLLYDARRPAQAVLLDDMPGGVVVDEHGQLQPANLRRAIGAVILPALVITVHAVVAYVVLVL